MELRACRTTHSRFYVGLEPPKRRMAPARAQAATARPSAYHRDARGTPSTQHLRVVFARGYGLNDVVRYALVPRWPRVSEALPAPEFFPRARKSTRLTASPRRDDLFFRGLDIATHPAESVVSSSEAG